MFRYGETWQVGSVLVSLGQVSKSLVGYGKYKGEIYGLFLEIL